MLRRTAVLDISIAGGMFDALTFDLHYSVFSLFAISAFVALNFIISSQCLTSLLPCCRRPNLEVIKVGQKD